MNDKTILLVEDGQEASIRWMARMEEFGYKYVYTHDPHMAIRIAASHRPDLVIMDVTYEHDRDYPIKWDINGILAAEQIYLRYDIPVIFLTASPNDVVKDHFLAKTFGLYRKIETTAQDVFDKAVSDALSRFDTISKSRMIFSLGVNNYSSFVPEDFTDARGLFSKLYNQNDGVSNWLWEHFPIGLQKGIENCNNAGVTQPTTLKLLIDVLNNLVRGPSIYDSDIFEGKLLRSETQLRADTEKLKNEQDQEIYCLNRLLLEDSYPSEIKPSLAFTSLNFKARSFFGCCLDDSEETMPWATDVTEKFREYIRNGESDGVFSTDLITKHGVKSRFKIDASPIIFFRDCVGLRCVVES